MTTFCSSQNVCDSKLLKGLSVLLKYNEISLTLVHAISPNATKYRTNKLKMENKNSSLGMIAVQDYQDGSGFIKFSFVTGDQEIKISILAELAVALSLKNGACQYRDIFAKVMTTRKKKQTLARVIGI